MSDLSAGDDADPGAAETSVAQAAIIPPTAALTRDRSRRLLPKSA
jgi:hypothetical protein